MNSLAGSDTAAISPRAREASLPDPVSCHWGNPLLEPDCDAWVMPYGACSFFHGASWLWAIHDSYGFQPMYLAFGDRDRFASLTPITEFNSLFTGRRGISLPFTDCCEPLIADSVPSPDLFQEIVQHGRSRESNLRHFRFEFARNRFGAENDGPRSWYYRCFSVLPVAASRLLGAILYRHSA